MKSKIIHKLGNLLYFIRLYPWQYSGIFCLNLFVGFLEPLNIALFLPIFNEIFGMGIGTTDNFLMGGLNRLLDILPFKDHIISACVMLIGVTVIRVIFNLLNESVIAYMGGKVMFDMRKKVMDKYINASYQYFLDNKQGDLIYRSNFAANKIAGILIQLPRITTEAIKIIFIFGLLLYMNISLTLGLTCLGFVYGIFIFWLSRKYAYPIGRRSNDQTNKLVAIMSEFLSGVKHIKVNNAMNKWKKVHDSTNRISSVAYALLSIIVFIPQNIMQLLTYSTIALAIIFFRLYMPGEFVLYLPMMAVFVMGFQRIMPSLNQVGTLSMRVVAELPLCEVVYATLHEDIEQRHMGKKPYAGFARSISFESVSFAYKERGQLLKKINDLEFKKNQVTAIVGPSGSGKTTIMNLLLGLYHPTSGRILVDDVDLSDYETVSWLDKIGFVSQEPFIFHSTIADNIAFSSDSYDEAKLIESAKLANAHNFIMAFPEGYQAVVGERGMKLSGGQQQRLSIARAIYRKPEIFIFDEATSSLDNVSEKLIQESIDRISKNKTVIIIAHRLSTIKNADCILVLEDGQIKERGTFLELLNKRGHFNNLYYSEAVVINEKK